MVVSSHLQNPFNGPGALSVNIFGFLRSDTATIVRLGHRAFRIRTYDLHHRVTAKKEKEHSRQTVATDL